MAGAVRSEVEDRIAGARYGGRRHPRHGHIRRRRHGRQSTRRIPRCAAMPSNSAAGDVAGKTSRRRRDSSDARRPTQSADVPLKIVRAAMGRPLRDAVDRLRERQSVAGRRHRRRGRRLYRGLHPVVRCGEPPVRRRQRKAEGQSPRSCGARHRKAGDIAAEAAGSVAAAAAREGLDAAASSTL